MCEQLITKLRIPHILLLIVFYVVLVPPVAPAHSATDLRLRHISPRAGAPQVVLVHGLNSGASIWTSMISALQSDYDIWTVEYPNDQGIALSAAALKRAIEAEPGLRKAAFVTHSMGGLVVRWMIEQEGGAALASHLIMLAPPNHGSALANPVTATTLEGLEATRALLRQYLAHVLPASALFKNPFDGDGDAYADLNRFTAQTGDNLFMARLNPANWTKPRGVNYVVIAGDGGPVPAPWMAARTSLAGASLRGVLRALSPAAPVATPTLRRLGYLLFPELHAGSGDLAVTLESAWLPTVPFYPVTANHGDIHLNPNAQGLVLQLLAGKTPVNERRPDLTLALVIDSSGSMRDNDPKFMRRSAATSLLALLPGATETGIIDFDDKTTLRASGYPWMDDLVSSLARIDASGGTDIAAALKKAYAWLDTTSSARRAIVLLSDGRSTEPVELSLVRADVPIHAISLGNDIDQPLMQALASRSGGLYHHASDAGSLQSLFLSAFSAVTDAARVASFTGIIQPGGLLNYSFVTDGSITDLLVSLFWRGSDLDLTLTAPDGSTYRPEIVGGTFEHLLLPQPQSGEWTIQVRGVEVPAGGEPCSVQVHANSARKLLLEYERETYPGNQPLEIGMRLSDGTSLAAAGVRAIVIAPDGTETVASPQDENAGLLLPLGNQEGSYTVRVQVRGTGMNQFQRESSGTIVVGTSGQTTANIGRVVRIQGYLAWVAFGRNSGVRAGMTIEFHKPDRKNPAARGPVTEIEGDECLVELLEVNADPAIGDLVRIAPVDWSLDAPKGKRK